MNSSGKVLIIFLIITAILLISITAISLFFFQKETERRKLAETTMKAFEAEKVKLEEDLKIIKKQNFLLEEKNKEADARVNDLSDELELEKGLREEMKLEAVALEKKLTELAKEKETFNKEIKESEGLKEKLTQELTTSQQKIKELEAQLKAEIERSEKLGKLYEQQQEESAKWEKTKAEQEAKADSTTANDAITPEDVVNLGVELGEIVVATNDARTMDSPSEYLYDEAVSTLDSMLDGRVLSVDTETEFVIVSLGKKDGLAVGNILSVYRNESYVGDIKITRLQSEMSAADLVQPLSIRNVQKDDQVKVK